jgi:hypothetical protein
MCLCNLFCESSIASLSSFPKIHFDIVQPYTSQFLSLYVVSIYFEVTFVSAPFGSHTATVNGNKRKVCMLPANK